MDYVRRPAGASATAIEEIERAFEITVPQALRQFVEDSDGAILYFGFKELQFFSLAEMLQDIYQTSKYLPGSLPLCMDGAGNICVGRIVHGHIDGIYVAPCGDLAWESAVKVAENFDRFMFDKKSPEDHLTVAGDDSRSAR